MNKGLKFILFFWCALLCYHSSSQNDYCKKVEALVELVKTTHYQPREINDSLSKDLQSMLLKLIDPKKRFFIQNDIGVLNKNQYQIDDFLSDGNCDFLEEYKTILGKRIKDAELALNELKEKKLDYSGKDSLYFDNTIEDTFHTNEESFKNFWDRRVRYAVLLNVIESNQPFDSIKLKFDRNKKEIQQDIINKELCLLEEFKNRNGNISNCVDEAFLNAFLLIHDPNSIYFDDSEKTSYEASLSNSQKTFGVITEKDDNGNIIISHIIEGSSASKNENINEKDKLISLSTGTETLNLDCVSNEDVMSFIYDINYDNMTFSVLNNKGDIKQIELTKTEVDVEENSITGYIIENQNKFGYLKIDSFYTNEESFNGYGVSNDVARTIYKLQKQNAKGLIIDLRFNGGGAMSEASELLGMFINRGPVSINRYKDDYIFTIRDAKGGVAYKGPIVIIVNQFSASASEFFSSGMQDYNNAIIIGSPTHGKATVQNIFPLSETESYGFAKLTIGKFYRVTGASHQSKGVVPDVILPSLYNGLKTEEKYEAYALKNDSVQVEYTHKPSLFDMKKKLVKSSKSRVENNEKFNDIIITNGEIISKVINKKKHFPLTLKAVYNDEKEGRSIWRKFSDFEQSVKTSYKVTPLNSTKKSKTAISNIENDLYIEEAYNILNDLISE